MYKNNAFVAKKKRKFNKPLILIILLVVALISYYFLFFNNLTIEERIEKFVTYDQTVTEPEQAKIEEYIISQEIVIGSNLEISSFVSDKQQNDKLITDTFVPVVDVYSVKQSVSKEELAETNIVFEEQLDDSKISQLKSYFENDVSETIKINLTDSKLEEDQLAIAPSDSLSTNLKLLSLENDFYLDTFNSGAFFRELSIAGDDSDKMSEFKYGEKLTSGQVYKTNITGVTALTRVMIRELGEVGEATFFSDDIGEFLSSADLTHVSNEVSFKPECSFAESSVMLFCSPPEFIETLKASGVDLVELTGNHNNDFGSEYNKQTIELYRSLGWGTVGGGLNNEDAAKAFITDAKGTKLAFLAYNYPDSPSGGAISGVERAGANSFDFSKIEADIIAAKQKADFVSVNVQYWECYAYPDGYVEYPECDKPIGEQEENFKRIIDLGADMVVGSSAHQPQTYEIYNGKPIYYGLGNLYFDQTQWPGTERGLVLSNYFIAGKLVQTKITPTVYGDDLKTRIMTDEETEYLLTRLNEAR